MYPSFRKLKLTFISISCILAFVMVLEHSSVSSSVTSAAFVKFLVPKPPIKKKPKAIATAQKSWLEVQKALLMSQHPERLWRCYKQLGSHNWDECGLCIQLQKFLIKRKGSGWLMVKARQEEMSLL